MTDRSQAAGTQWRRPGLGASALAVLLITWTGAAGDVRADSIVLKSGEVIDGSIVDATRNTVIVHRSIGGMRQMRIQDIEEVRIDLAQGQEISGQFLSWADGIYQVRSGGQVIRISQGNVLSREPREEALGQPPRPPSRPTGEQAVRMAAAPSARGAGEAVAQQPRGQDRGAAAGDAESQAAGDTETQAAAEAKSQAAGETRSLAAARDSEAAGAAESRATSDARSQAAGETRSLAAARDAETQAAGDAETQAAADAETQAAADAKTQAAGETRSLAAARDAEAAGADESQAARGAKSQAAGETRSLAAARDGEPQAAGDAESQAASDAKSLAVRASVDPPEPGAESIVFKIELSRPAEQTVVLIYGTVDGTAKAGEDYEPQQGMMTLPPGTQSAEVRVPLLDGEPAEGEKRFELFLTADSRVAEIVDKQVVATIKDAD